MPPPQAADFYARTVPVSSCREKKSQKMCVLQRNMRKQAAQFCAASAKQMILKGLGRGLGSEKIDLKRRLKFRHRFKNRFHGIALLIFYAKDYYFCIFRIFHVHSASRSTILSS